MRGLSASAASAMKPLANSAKTMRMRPKRPSATMAFIWRIIG
jgi:hypothetical protein